MDEDPEIDDLVDNEEDPEIDDSDDPSIDDEIIIDDESSEDDEDEEEPSYDIDDDVKPPDEQEGFVIDDSDDGGSAPEPYDEDPIPYEERIPVGVPETKLITVSISEIISDFSAESLALYEENGAIPYAVYDDGTKVEVEWSEVTIPDIGVGVVVTEAESLAKATNQHFWSRATDPDNDGAGTGAFVTDDEQLDFLTAAASNFPDIITKPWHNILMNSLGILLRSGFNNLVSLTRSGIAFYDGAGNVDANILASFGSNGSRIGKNGNANLNMNYNNMSLVDKNGNVFFKVDDMRDNNGAAIITETFKGSGRIYDLQYLATQILICTVDGVVASYTSSTRLQVTRVVLDAVPSSGSSVVIAYKTESQMAKSYTLGTRAPNSIVGAMSLAEGYDVKASGYASHAENSSTEASGRASHAEGSFTKAEGDFSHAEGGSTHATGNHSHAEGNQATASGYNSHAEGNQTKAIGGDSHAEGWSSESRGARSHAQNERTIALGLSQTVIGRFNSVDQNDEYALIIGNGGEWDDSFVDPDNPNYDYDDEYTHSNALTVDWDGNVVCNEVNGLALQSLGEIREASGSSTPVPNRINTNIAYVRLSPGTWLVNAKLRFLTVNAVGMRTVKLSTISGDSGSPISTDTRTADSDSGMYLQTERVFAITDSEVESEQDGKIPIYLIAWQNSGISLNASGDIQAVRISPAIGESYDGGGGSSSISSYSDLLNKPSIEGITLTGDKSFPDLGIFIDSEAQYPQSDDYALTTLEINALWNNVMA